MVEFRLGWRLVQENWGNVFLSAEVLRGSASHIYVYVFVLYGAGMLTQPFLPQASRQFDQEGRKKFFTLDMNNILLEWVGQLLNHRQPHPSSLSSSSALFQSFSLIFSRFPLIPPLLSSSVFFPLCLSLSVLIKCFSFPHLNFIFPHSSYSV